MVLVCLVKNCKNSKRKTRANDSKFFRIPKNGYRYKQWLLNCDRQDLCHKPVEELYKNVRVCNIHFKMNMFSNPEKNRLLYNALPTEFDLKIMPNNICVFGCNRMKKEKLSMFSIPKDKNLRDKWLNSLDIDLHNNQVVCEKHFHADQIKRKIDMFDKLGNIVCSAPLSRPRLQPYAVPYRYAGQKREELNQKMLKTVEPLSSKLNVEEQLNQSFQNRNGSNTYDLLSSNINMKKHLNQSSKNQNISNTSSSLSSNIKDSNSGFDNILVTSCMYNHILLDHNYTAKPQLYDYDTNLDNCDTSVLNLNTTEIFQKNMHIELPVSGEQFQNKFSFWQLNTLDLHLPHNWHTFFSSEKKYFSICEIVFIENQENIKSFLSKNIILNQSLSITCNVLGININTNKFINAVGNIENQKHLEKLIKEVAMLKICKGLDLLNNKYNLSLSVNDHVICDSMQSKRVPNCPVLISNGSYCIFCKRTLKKIRRKHKLDLQKMNNDE